MYGEEVIEFQVLPELDKILEEIKRLSGLSDLTWVDDRKTKLIHPEFTKREFSLLVDGNTIRLARGWIDKWYLL
ncbi:MAG TPA: hypothetical protein VG737_15995, partial [Cyclobacteriaceae bacterium]|nr:hypothetical protein [Cyclobacteriaceae bacterium]